MERQGGEEDVFLRKVRLGNEMEAAEKRSDATSAEKEALKRIREVAAAGEEALKIGRDAKGRMLFDEANRLLEVWKHDVDERLGREAEQWRKAEEFQRKMARLEKELEAEGKRSDATSAEKEGLKRIREVVAAGEAALKTGKDVKGEVLYAEATRRLESWKRGVEERLAFEADQQRRDAEAQRERLKDEAEQRQREKEARNEQEQAEDWRWRGQAAVGRIPKETEEERKRREEEAEREKKLTEEGRHRREETTRKMQEKEEWLRTVMMRRLWMQ